MHPSAFLASPLRVHVSAGAGTLSGGGQSRLPLSITLYRRHREPAQPSIWFLTALSFLSCFLFFSSSATNSSKSNTRWPRPRSRNWKTRYGIKTVSGQSGDWLWVCFVSVYMIFKSMWDLGQDSRWAAVQAWWKCLGDKLWCYKREMFYRNNPQLKYFKYTLYNYWR